MIKYTVTVIVVFLSGFVAGLALARWQEFLSEMRTW